MATTRTYPKNGKPAVVQPPADPRGEENDMVIVNQDDPEIQEEWQYGDCECSPFGRDVDCKI